MSEGNTKPAPVQGAPSDWDLKDAIKPEFLVAYKSIQRDIWNRLSRVHAAILILEELVKFPFAYFVSPTNMAFWNMTAWSLQGMAIVLMHGLLSDQIRKGTVCTLKYLKNCLMKKEWLNPQYVEPLRQRLRRAKFTKELRKIEERVSRTRHDFFAHRLIDKKTGLPVNSLWQKSDKVEFKLDSRTGHRYNCDVSNLTGGHIDGHGKIQDSNSGKLLDRDKQPAQRAGPPLLPEAQRHPRKARV